MLASPAYRTLRSEFDGPVVTITLDRPEKRNALSLEMMGELTAALRAAGADRDVRAVILRANGPAFSAGHDLAEMHAADLVATRHIFDVCVELMETIQNLPQPVIAEVHALATAAGCQLVATCDLAVASSEARFATPGVKIGLFCTTPMVALSRAVGRKRALEMLLTGVPIDAGTAAEWGLVNTVVAPDRLRETTRALAERVCAASGYVTGLGKGAFYAQIDLDQSKAYRYAKEVMSLNAMDVDAREGIGAFLGKREPHWSH